MAHNHSHLPASRPPHDGLRVVDNVISGSGSERTTCVNGCSASTDFVTSQEEKQLELPLRRSATSINASDKSALLVENDQSLKRVLKEWLKRAGYAVRTACCAEAGLRLYEHCAPFFVVIIDYAVPNNWAKLATAIRQQNPSQAMVIAAFAYRYEEEVPRPRELMEIPLLLHIKQLRRVLRELQYWATRDEVDRAIGRLTPAELLRLEKVADWRVRGLGRAGRGKRGEDLLQEALLRTFEGTEGGNGRRWNKRVDFFTYLLGAIRSKADNWKKQNFRELETYSACEVVTYDVGGQELSPFDKIASSSPAADRCLGAKEEVDGIFKLFERDNEAGRVLQGWSESMTAREVMQRYELTKQQYEAAVKRIRCRVHRARSRRTNGES